LFDLFIETLSILCLFVYESNFILLIKKIKNTFFKIEAIDLIDNFKNLKEINLNFKYGHQKHESTKPYKLC
jgi:hypothetical protein